MKSKSTISKRHCPGEDYEISFSICRGRQKAHYPKCHKCEFKTGVVSTSTTDLSEEQSTGTLRATKSGLAEKTRKKATTGTKPDKDGPKVKRTRKTSKVTKLKKTGSIMVKSKPSSATIVLDGDSIGITPAIIRQILPGKYEVEVKTDGYDTWKQMVNVVANKETSLNAVLQGKNGSIVVESDPVNARIYVDNDYIGVTPAEICQVVPGTYEVKVMLEGYDIWKKRVSVEANKEESLSAILQGKNGNLAIESKPTKAKIYINGNYTGDTPVTITDIKPGEHTVKIKLDEYETWEKVVKIEPEKETFISAALLKEYGSLILESEPSDAKISLDGKNIGTTPTSLSSVPYGTHLVEVMKDGYEVWNKKVEVEPGKETSLTATLQLQTGSISIESKPTKAMIYLDGRHVGTTPESLKSIVPGTHELNVKLDGYDVWSELVNVEAGKEKVLTASLQINTGSVMIESTPSKAIIYFDGNRIGETPDIILSSSIGTHHVEVRKEGYNTWTKSIDIESGKEKSLSAILQVTTGSVSINSQPSPATIILDEKEAGFTPSTITNLVPGTHKIEVRKSGYEVWSDNVEVIADKEKSFTTTLQKIKGSICINSKPASAIIYLDDNEVGTTPDTLSAIDIGSHEIKVCLEGYNIWKKVINVKKGKEKNVNAVLQINTGSVSIKSDPVDAKIFINGDEYGITPQSITGIKTGINEVEVKLDGYMPWEKTVKIKPGKETSFVAKLQEITGAVNINSEPPSAMVRIDGNKAGTTPVTLAEISPGNHLVEISKDGYEGWSESVDIIPDKELSLTATLQMQAGSVCIRSEPSDAMVFLNEKEIGTTPVTITELTPGTHMVEVKIDGYECWSKSVEVIPGKEVSLTADLLIITGSVSIKSEPSDAMVLLDENNNGNTPIIITDLKPGKHVVEVRMEGYEDWSESIDIISEKEVALMADLHMKPGSVSIKSTPSNAMVYLDEKDIGSTPVSITDLQPGTCQVEIKMDGYENWNETINIINGKEISLTAELQTLPGSVSIQSNPSNAMVLLDDNEAGETPVTIADLRPGTYSVKVKLDGYEDWSESIDIISEKEVALMADLHMKPGSVSIKSTPSNAMVYLDEKDIGSTPVSVTDLQPGTRQVEIKMDGYENWDETINIINGREISLTAELQILPGSVSIQSNPSNAMVLLDDNKAGETPVTIADLSPGTHSVEVKMDGYEDWSEVVEIIPDKETAISTDLQMKTGSVCINSEPSNARVLIDGKEIGATPVTTTDLIPGTFNVEVMMEGYENWKENLDVIPEKKISLTATLKMKPGSVIIKSEPPDATVLLDDKEAGTTPITIADLKPGIHNLEVSMAGHEKWIEKVEIKPNEENLFTAVLNKITGSISIKSKPSKAQIYLDGNEVGTTPDTLKTIDIGQHEIEVRAEGHALWKESINIIKGKNKKIKAVLQVSTGSFNIKSEPSGATVFIDGNEAGKTPVTIADLKPRMHSVEIKKEGYGSWSERMEITPDKETVIAAELQMKTGSVTINSNPQNANVLIEGKEIGTTPVTATDLMPGTFNVEVTKEGYENWKENVDVIPEKKISLTATLKVKPGSVSIKSEPTDATVLLDDKDVGITPVTIADLKPGIHNLEVKMEGHEKWSEKVNIKPDEENSFTAVLRKITGNISVKSNPTNAILYLDGQEIGTTPNTLKSIGIGSHEFEVVCKGYKTWKESINIKKGGNKNINAVLQIHTGFISIESEPSNARTIIDGSEAGNTPVTITDLKPGMHNVEVKMNGYRDWEEKVDIIPGSEITITAALQVKEGSVTIKSEPTAAKTIIDGKEVGTTPVTITDMEPGTHNVEVSMAGYDDWKESVDIIHDKEIILSAALQKNTGSLIIKSEPSDAMVIIDDKETGATPITIIDLKSGTYNVAVRIDGYDDWRENVDIEPDKETTLTANLQEKTGSVSITSEPTGAIALIDGEEVGVTPKIAADLIPGMHNVEIIKDGYVNCNKSVNIVTGEETTFTAELQLKTGVVSIKSEPPGAKTLIDGNEIGTTPVTITDLKPGKHNVEVSMAGYENWYEKVDIKSDMENSFSATLHKITGSIVIKSNPSNAIIYLDGEEAGTTPDNLQSVTIGQHEIEIKKEGYISWKNSININKGKNKKIKAVLQKNVGSFRIKSIPSNAKIVIDGNEAGVTPIAKTDLKPAIYNVEVMKDGYDSWNEKIEIIPGKEIDLKPVLQMKAGSINLKSDPSNAKVLINGTEEGITPVTKTGLKPAIYTVEVKKNGYDDWNEKVEIIPGKEIDLKPVLQMKVGSINLMSKPSGSTILTDGNIVGTTPLSITDLKPGTHQVETRLDGYEDWRESVDIIPGKVIELTAVHKLKTGSINLKSEPPNAKALIDGKEAGVTPMTQTDLKPGTYDVEVLKDGYEDWKESVKIIHDKEITLSAKLQIKVGSVSIKSEPSDAIAFIDGKEAGTTPKIITDLDPGTHMVEIKKEGHENWKEKVVVETDKENSIVAILQKSTGSISIKSTPSNAKIYIDGEEAGTTPSTLSSINVGTREIEIKIGGYEDWKKSLIIKKGEKSVNAILQLNIGSISIESYPEKAKIILDGKEIGMTPKRLTDIIVGVHEVEVLMDGYITWKKTIKIKAGKETSLTADMEKVNDTIESEIFEPVYPDIPELEPKPEKGEDGTITQPQKLEPPAFNKKTKYLPDELIKLRSTYNRISDSQINSLPKISVREKNNSIFFCHSTVNHCYELKPIADGEVVIDHTTELMWYQSGSNEYFNLKKAIKWIKIANKECYAGFDNWRLPTLEEAVSLLEPEVKNDSYIDPVFDKKQWGTWTGDKHSRSNAWIVTFVNGTVNLSPVGSAATFVRPVRTLQK